MCIFGQDLLLQYVVVFTRIHFAFHKHEPLPDKFDLKQEFAVYSFHLSVLLGYA